MSILTVPSHCFVTVRRPSGVVETVDYTVATKGKIKSMCDRVLEVANQQMASAGRGQIISYVNVTKEVDAPVPSAKDLADEQYRLQHNAIMRASAGGELSDIK